MLGVFKFGGGATLNLEALARDAAELAKQGWQLVIVAGGNAALEQAQKKFQQGARIITSERGEKSRFTDAATLVLLKKVYGQVAENIARVIREAGGEAVAQAGSVENLIWARRHERLRILENGKRKVIPADLTGRIEEVAEGKIKAILAQKKVLVLYPPAASLAGELNVDGDKIAEKVAGSLWADYLIFFAETAGVLRNFPNEASRVAQLTLAEAEQFAVGRMKKKILAAKRALAAGVQKIIFADGRLEDQPIQRALAGQGTKVLV